MVVNIFYLCKMKKLIIFLVYIAFVFSAKAYRIDSVAIHSNTMTIDVKTIVIIPDVALGEEAVKCPVIYLLHGYGGYEKSWIIIKPELPRIADEKGIIFVCPDGKNSWYINSPLLKTSQYETFISSELIDYIDHKYNTLADSAHRAITGLSMGGHGALFNALRHNNVFGAAGSMSGAVDIRHYNNKFGLQTLLGNKKDYPYHWEANAVPNQISRIQDGMIAIIFDCGTSDFTFSQNEALHKMLINQNIGHDYTTRPGAHTLGYWCNSIDYHILFFCNFFRKEKNKK